jgi:hypothetical protein
MMLQLDPPIPVYVIDKGSGLAHLVIDMGAEYNILWVVILDDMGEIWTFDNTRVRGVKNITMGREKIG